MNIGTATSSSMNTTVPNYSVPLKITDAATGNEETEWQNAKASQYFGYYKTIPELKKAIDAFANYIVGRGYVADTQTSVILDHIQGWGEDTFNSIIWNMIVCKKVYGDAFAEIVRDPETDILVNLKVLDPSTIKIVCDKNGFLKHYIQTAKAGGKEIKFQPEEILHLCNDRVADEIHGTSNIEACEWTILARNEAMNNWKTVLHRNINPLKIVELDTDDQTKINAFITKWETTVKDKETIFIPKGSASVTIPPIPLQDPLAWISYLENFFYQAVGIPRIILGGTAGETESSAKVGYTTFDQTYIREQTELAADLWAQLYIKVYFNKPASLMDNLQTDQSKDGMQGLNTQQGEMAVNMNNQEGGM